MDQFPLKARLTTQGRASTYNDMHTQVADIATRFFGSGRWKILDYDVDAYLSANTDGTVNIIDFPYTATVAGPTT